jgi:PIN domain nuclease of toxin-antitoxin system
LTLFLDTNALILFHQGDQKIISRNAVKYFDEADELYISPIVLLELQYLKEVGRIRYSANAIIDYMHNVHGIEVEEQGFSSAVRSALQLSWTRDPFDRIITAHASIYEAWLLTKDDQIRSHYDKAVW